MFLSTFLCNTARTEIWDMSLERVQQDDHNYVKIIGKNFNATTLN